MKTVLVVFGTRPEAVKLAPVVRALRQASARFRTIVAVTAQHREMLDPFLQYFEIKPDHDLDVMTPDQTLFDLHRTILPGLERVMRLERPDVVIVQGDTTTALLSALAAYYLKIPVAHVEAGLRTLNKYSPFPEEMNRRLLGSLAEWHFAPTLRAKKALLQEHVPASQIFVTGNTGIDALVQAQRRIRTQSPHRWFTQYPFVSERGRRLILVTAHRRENFGEGLQQVCSAVKAIVSRWSDVRVVFPVHLNPRVRSTVVTLLQNHPRLHLCDPLDYESFVYLMTRAHFILTDSGGIQEEATFLGKPFLILRNVTERQEALHAGVGRLVQPSAKRILREARRLLDDTKEYARRARPSRAFGDGKAAQRILHALGQVLVRAARSVPATGSSDGR